ncbi:hypothetical protein [Acanthopleuribacter pedis]|uniref:DUF4412 domain-containing protein n=1 Tax=Acanthopleuribacter pedis TaxID=442870 RepID=A0A8J7Q7Q4_9BACT|nr:hypothetical protein [Acanthopleuribacter pedis]MBO1322267.1 hypothetical protein [Acanthopleuribacter pedis]
MTLLFLFSVHALLLQLDQKTIFYLREEIEMRLPDGVVEVKHRDIWIGLRRMRIDNVKDGTSMIYAQGINSMFLLDHRKREYVFATSGSDRRVAQRPLFGLAALENGMLVKRGKFVTPLKETRKIGDFNCRAFELNYPEDFGLTTKIYASELPVFISPRTFLRIWYAAAGVNPPQDVRYILGSLMRELKGVPIQIVSEIEQEGFQIVTTSTITVIERRQDFEPQLFEIPKGYRRGDLAY